MPPPDAVKSGKVAPLSDEDRRTLVRWIDLGCPIDLAYDPQGPARSGFGWALDDQRPTLTVASPKPGANAPLDRILVETDCPYLAPVPHRGKTNEPAFVVRTLEKLAEVRGTTPDAMARTTNDNFFRLFTKVPRPISPLR